MTSEELISWGGENELAIDCYVDPQFDGIFLNAVTRLVGRQLRHTVKIDEDDTADWTAHRAYFADILARPVSSRALAPQ